MNKLEHVVGKNGNPSRPQAAMQEMDMLEPCALEALFLELGTPDAGRRLIVKARQQAPVRQVRSTGKNVITFLASRKMGREIATESRTVEYIAALVSTSGLKLTHWVSFKPTLTIEQFERSPARALAQTLRSWLEPIVRMWRFTKSNGITEGFRNGPSNTVLMSTRCGAHYV